MKKSLIKKLLSLFIVLTFSLNLIIPPSYAQVVSTTLMNLPTPGTMIATTPAFAPAAMRGLMIYPDNPLKFDFVIDRGDTKMTEDEFKAESTKLVRYFLASLTVPEKDMWVNLSPYEKNRIVPENFGQTEMGRDLLAQDYILKQLTASLMYPENETGKEFWNKIYAKINERFGMTDIPLNTFNKVWIIPDKVSIYEHTKGAFIVKGRLKVMLEEDYVAMENNSQKPVVNSPEQKQETNSSLTATIQSQMVREIIIPEIEREVNEGSTFTQLRQIYYSMILASWYKKALKESLLGKVYVDQNKTEGVDIADKNENQKIYEKYIEAFKQGAYDYVKEDYNAETQEVVTRKYISGGVQLTDPAMVSENDMQKIKGAMFALAKEGDIATFELNGGADAAMLSRREFLKGSAGVLAGLLLTPLIGEAGQNGEEAARLYQEANSLSDTSPEQAEQLYRQALPLAETTTGRMKIINNLADSLEKQNKIKEATATYEQALGLARNLIQSKDINEDNKFAIAAVYLNVGDMYTLQGNLQNARLIYTEAKFLDPIVFDTHSKYPGIKRIYDILRPALFKISIQAIENNPIATQFNQNFRHPFNRNFLDFQTIKGEQILMFGTTNYTGREMYDEKQIRLTGLYTIQIITPDGIYKLKKDVGIVSYQKSDNAMTSEKLVTAEVLLAGIKTLVEKLNIGDQRTYSFEELTTALSSANPALVTNSGEVRRVVENIVAGTLDFSQQGFMMEIQSNGVVITRIKVGGIDFNPENLKMNLKKEGDGVQFAPISDEAIQGMNINGFVPVIINVVPATNLPFLLGIKKDDQKENLAYSS